MSALDFKAKVDPSLVYFLPEFYLNVKYFVAKQLNLEINTMEILHDRVHDLGTKNLT